MNLTSEERERMNWLCLEIQEETDHARFTDLVRELNQLLESKEDRLDPAVKKQES